MLKEIVLENYQNWNIRFSYSQNKIIKFNISIFVLIRMKSRQEHLGIKANYEKKKQQKKNRRKIWLKKT